MTPAFELALFLPVVDAFDPPALFAFALVVVVDIVGEGLTDLVLRERLFLKGVGQQVL